MPDADPPSDAPLSRSLAESARCGDRSPDDRVDSLSGHIERITFHNPENGFSVLRVAARGQREEVTVVGHATRVSEGEEFDARGRWVVDGQHGRQFKATEIKTFQPTSAQGIERYLASGAIRSIGPQLAKRIVAIHGDRTLDVFEQHSDMLVHVHGIGPKRLQRIRQSWVEQSEIRRIMLFLQELGIGSGGRATKIYRTYGECAIERIRENPYRLADDIRGIGFRTADEIAARLGIAPHAPERLRAAVRFALSELAREGHCGYFQAGVCERTGKLVNVAVDVILAEVEFEVAEQRLVRETIDDEPWLYLPPLYRAEVGVANHVHRLAGEASHPLTAINVSAAIDWVQGKLGIELAAGQKRAIEMVCRHKLVVITGGPGVGKTTLVKSLIEIFAAKDQRCLLAAPTGRAAKRLTETTGHPAKTVHRLLEFDPISGDFKRNAHRPLRADLLVMDETSMVDIVLANQFLRAVPSTACLVLVGDVDQLPSVGPGTVLENMIDSQAVPVARLTEIFRQARESRIIRTAYDVNLGRLPNLTRTVELDDFYFVEADEPDDIARLVVKLVSERIAVRFGVDPLDDIQVLTPMNRSVLGARNLNQVLRETLNPDRQQPQVERFGVVFREGDRVIQTVNNYDRDVFNGDLGRVHRVNRVEQQLTASFDHRLVKYDFDDLDELSLAYVLTIHKSQGSEYPCVVIPLHTQHYTMLQRNLLYTAITRGKQLVVLVGSRKALAMAVRRRDARGRLTALRHRLSLFAPRTSGGHFSDQPSSRLDVPRDSRDGWDR